MVLFDDEVGQKLEGCVPLISCLVILEKSIEAQLLPRVLRGQSTHRAGAWHSSFEKYLNTRRRARDATQVEALSAVCNTTLTVLWASASCIGYTRLKVVIIPIPAIHM